LANELIDKEKPADYNQSIMEFGALQCKPKSPNCEICPFLLECYAYKNDKIDQLPFKSKKVKQRNRYFNYLVIKHKGKTYLNKRNEKDIWAGLYDFPLIETKKPFEDFNSLINVSDSSILKELKIDSIKKSVANKHVLSHQKIYATFWEISIQDNFNKNSILIATPIEKITNFAVPKLIDNYLKTVLENVYI